MRSASATNDPCRGFGPFPERPSEKKGILHRCVILFCIKSIASKGRPEGFQRAIGKPFGRARRRETSALGKAILLSENSNILSLLYGFHCRYFFNKMKLSSTSSVVESSIFVFGVVQQPLLVWLSGYSASVGCSRSWQSVPLGTVPSSVRWLLSGGRPGLESTSSTPSA